MTNWQITVDGQNFRRGMLTGADLHLPCALGRCGVITEIEKREGDEKTPLGRFPVRRAFYRPDRQVAPVCHIPLLPLSPDMGWCDDSDSPAYNRMVRLPFAAPHEKMWRDDALYDLGLIIGHNDAPPLPGLGSAIFLHVAGRGSDGRFKPTRGCAAFDTQDMRRLIEFIMPDDFISIGAD